MRPSVISRGAVIQSAAPRVRIESGLTPASAGTRRRASMQSADPVPLTSIT